MIKYIKSLKKNILIYWTGLTTSMFGDALYTLALPLIAYGINKSIMALGLTFAIQIIPTLIFGSLSGVIIDKFNKIKIIIFSDIFRSLCLLIFLYLLLFSTITEVHVYLITFIMSLISLLSSPSHNVLIKINLQKDELLTYNSLLMFSRNTIDLLGKASGGVLVSLLGAPIAILINALSFIISTVCLLISKLDGGNTNSSLKNNKFWKNVTLGLKTLWLNKDTRSHSIRMAILNICIAPLTLSLPLVSERIGGEQAINYGFLTASFALGALFASLYSVSIDKKVKNNKFYDWLIIAFALLLPLISITTNIITSCLIVIIIGFLTDLCIIYSMTGIQNSTNTEYLGRVFTFNSMTIRTLVPIVLLSLSFVIPIYGLLLPLTVTALVIIIVIFYVLFINKNNNSNIKNRSLES